MADDGTLRAESDGELGGDGGFSPGVTLFGRYTIVAALGRGGMGAVYRARDEKLGRHVAIKTLTRTSLRARLRLEREAKALAALEHSAIVRVFDFVEDSESDLIVVVMELVRGKSLRELVRLNRLEPQRATAIIADVADTLQAAHRVGLVHRDVKPDNIMVTEDGKTKLIDFGIAKALTDELLDTADASGKGGTPLTADGAIVGTPAYLAPEQWSGAAAGPAADQFALAVTAFELLTGALPWAIEDLASPLLAMASTPPRNASALAPQLTRQLDEVLARALSKEPKKRFVSIEEFAATLSHAAAGVAAKQLDARAQPARPAMPGAASRRRVLFGLALLLAGGVAAAGLWLRSVPDETAKEPAEPADTAQPEAPGGLAPGTPLVPCPDNGITSVLQLPSDRLTIDFENCVGCEYRPYKRPMSRPAELP